MSITGIDKLKPEILWLNMGDKEKAILHELICERLRPENATMAGSIRIGMIDALLSDRYYG